MEGESTLFTKNDNDEYVPYAPPSFQDSIPETLKGNELFKEIADSGQLAQKYFDLFSAQPQKPQSIEAYEYELPKDIPIVEQDFMEFKKLALDLGLPVDQFKRIMDHYMDREKRLMENFKADELKHREESENELKRLFGDKYEATVKRANVFLDAVGKKLGDENYDEFRKWLDDTKFGDDPMVIRLLAKATELISEDTYISGDSTTQTGERPINADGTPRLRFKSMGD